jgi:hypothetical protein
MLSLHDLYRVASASVRDVALADVGGDDEEANEAVQATADGARSDLSAGAVTDVPPDSQIAGSATSDR